MLGGTIVATFSGEALNPNGVYDIVVRESGKELARAGVNMGALRQQGLPGPRPGGPRAPRLRPGPRVLKLCEFAPAYDSTLTTTRRFWARPSRVSFGPAGFSSP